MAEILAAGTLPWRREAGGRLQVAVIHRPKYDDWSWPKGKLDPGESFAAAAARETYEETGLMVRLGHPLPISTYALANGRTGSTKVVRYWAAEVTGGDGGLVNEVDEVAWLDVDAAIDRLSHPRDRDQIKALVAADIRGTLTTWPLLVVRHAKAERRSSAWQDQDWLRPLDECGRQQASGLVPVLSAYGVERLVSSPATRAKDTLAPFATATGVKLRLKQGLSEEGHSADPEKAGRHLEKLLRRGAPAALCSHGPVLPSVTERLLERPGAQALGAVEEVHDRGLAKGEALVVHLAGTGHAARVVAAERYRPGAPG